MFLVSQSQISPHFHCIVSNMEKNTLTKVLGEVGGKREPGKKVNLVGPHPTGEAVKSGAWTVLPKGLGGQGIASPEFGRGGG